MTFREANTPVMSVALKAFALQAFQDLENL